MKLHVKISILISCIFSGMPTVVKTNILIRSMGPVSELDMVSFEIFQESYNNKFASSFLAVTYKIISVYNVP